MFEIAWRTTGFSPACAGWACMGRASPSWRGGGGTEDDRPVVGSAVHGPGDGWGLTGREVRTSSRAGIPLSARQVSCWRVRCGGEVSWSPRYHRNWRAEDNAAWRAARHYRSGAKSFSRCKLRLALRQPRPTRHQEHGLRSPVVWENTVWQVDSTRPPERQRVPFFFASARLTPPESCHREWGSPGEDSRTGRPARLPLVPCLVRQKLIW